MATKNGKTRDYVYGPLTTRLHMSTRLVRASVSASFGDTASVSAMGSAIRIRHFLAPPISILACSDRFSVPRVNYNTFWPDESICPISDCLLLQDLLDSGHEQIDTLVLITHHAYNYIGWIGWAKQMSKMSGQSSFGIGYMFVFVSFHLVNRL